MRVSMVSAALLCLTTWMSMVHTNHVVTNCCLQWSKTRVPVQRILDYTNQSEGICPIAAVVFQTKSGKRLCSNPNSRWAQRAIQKVDEEKNNKALQEKGQNEEGSTRDTTPAVPSSSMNAPQQQKNRNGRKRQRNKSRAGRKGQRKRL